MGEVMSNDVQSHEDVVERVAGEDRRANTRHAARSLGEVTARIIGGSQVDLVNFSNRGVLFECDSRLLIGARASVRITTTDANLIVSGRVVRSRVKGLVNGALRYDAALVLDTELGLVPTLPIATADDAGDDDMVAFESELDATFDPSPVEAYLAESEASLLDVAGGSDLPLLATPPAVDSPAAEGTDVEAPAEPEAIAFEADGDVSFEPSEDFAFDEANEAVGAIEATVTIEVTAAVERADEESAGTSMFDATYIPPSDDEAPVAVSQFDVTQPTPAPEPTPSSFFDARPSDNYGDAPDDAAVAFEAEDGVQFEEAFEEAVEQVVEQAVEAGPAIEPASIEAGETSIAGDVPPPLPEFVAVAPPEAALDDPIDPPAAVPDTEDRVLLQFAATVPHDLAELRRIAADNQW